MLTLLFWNLARNPLAETLYQLAEEHSIDILILAECEISTSQMLLTLNQQRTVWDFAHGICPKIKIYTRFSPDYCRPIREGNRLTFRRVNLPLRTEFLLMACHLPAKNNQSEVSQMLENTIYRQEIIRAQEIIGHDRTLVIGDFNQNPFDPGMSAATGFHGIMDRRIAQQESRTVSEQAYSYFYNPMWGLFGDSFGIPGTYYYRRAEQVCYFWNMFDQVLLRPALLPYWQTDSIRILTEVQGQSLLNSNQVPDKRRFSDHLPLLVRLHL